MAKAAVKTKEIKEAKEPRDAGVLYVRDLLVGDRPRTHELRDSAGNVRAFTFENKHTDVAVFADMALPLVHNEGFEVRRNPDEEALRPMAREKENAVLQGDETVAKFTELKRSALIYRVRQLGWDVDEKTTTENELITVLMGGIKDTDEAAEISDKEIEDTVVPQTLLDNDPLISQFKA